MAKNYKRFLLLTKSVRYKKFNWQLIFKFVTGLPTTSFGIFYVSPIRNYWYFDIVTWKHYIIFVLMSGLQITLIDIQHLTSRHKLWLILRERRREIFPSLHPPLSTPIWSTHRACLHKHNSLNNFLCWLMEPNFIPCFHWFDLSSHLNWTRPKFSVLWKL